MSELTDFLLARIAEDEEVARMPPPGPWSFNGPPRETGVYSEPTGVTVAHVWQRDAHHIARWNPARVLAECEAKRRIVTEVVEEIDSLTSDWADATDATPFTVDYPSEKLLRLLALPYADHPDYDERWRP